MTANGNMLQIYQKFDNVFFDSRNSAEFMQDSLDAHGDYRRPADRGEQNTAQRIAQCYSVASLKRLNGNFTVRRGGFLYYDLMTIMLHILPHLSFH
ncbi:hypothetical protein SDC9_112048 [bioreactor metagenome]|uniref:Uncharacterized protein n=1 Tax=bioreactor metagenome TaxID=1076179 RepID=A0A645BIY7_9ZZZZ